MIIRIVGKAMLSGKGFENIERILDRAIGKATLPLEHTGSLIVDDPFARIRQNAGIVPPKENV